MKNFWSKWFISASSGIFSKLIFITVLLGGGIVGSMYLLPEESELTKKLVSLTPFFVGYIASSLPMYLGIIRSWRREAKEDNFRELELKNENLQLENQKLKLELELRQQEQQSPPNQEE